MSRTFKIAAVQACPVYLDREATIAKACRLIAEVGAAGGELAVFPEAFVSGYPLWVWFVPAGHTHPLRELYAEFVANAVAVPSDSTAQLCDAAKKAGVAVAIGINEVNAEGSGSTIYNTLLYIAPDGAILGKHRKVMPTGGERLVWAMGDGSELEVYSLPFGRVGGLLCWENYMPLARYAMSAWGTEIFVAPTWDRGEPWLSTMRHVAKEGRCYVVSCCTPMHKDDIPGRMAFKGKYLGPSRDGSILARASLWIRMVRSWRAPHARRRPSSMLSWIERESPVPGGSWMLPATMHVPTSSN